MRVLNFVPKKIALFLVGIVVISSLASCGIYKPVDARKVSPNAKERVKKNLEEGKGFSLKKMAGGALVHVGSKLPRLAGLFKNVLRGRSTRDFHRFGDEMGSTPPFHRFSANGGWVGGGGGRGAQGGIRGVRRPYVRPYTLCKAVLALR